MIKVVYDNIVFSLQNTGGISNYWYQLSDRFLKNNIDISFFENSNSKNIFQKILKNNKNIIFLRISSYPILLERFFNVNVRLNKPFIFHSSYNRITKNNNAIQIVTIHDLIHEKFYNGLRKYFHVFQKKKALNHSSHIIAVSENTKKDILKYYPKIRQEKISVIYNGVSDDFIYNNEKNENYILFIGSREKYKNFNKAVELLTNFKDFRFVIVGKYLNLQETELLNLYLYDRWKLYTEISTLELNNLYNKAFALLYPSLYEGFGIPLLECMKAGCPFIALSNSSIPEVAGNAGVLLSELTTETLKTAIAYIKNNREQIKVLGFTQSNKFSWEKSYDDTLSLYKKLYNENINNNSCI
jgi:mannosyltransferase